MSPYQRAIYRGQVGELLSEARGLAYRFPNLYGATISGKRKAVADQIMATHRPRRSDFPTVEGWGRLPLLAAIHLDTTTCLYAGDDKGAGFASYRRLAEAYVVAGLGCDGGATPLSDTQRGLSADYLLVAMCVVGKVGLPGSGLSVVAHRAEHEGWDGECRVIALRHGLFRATVYQLSATLAGLSIEPPADSPTHIPPIPDAGGKTLKMPSDEAFQCYRLKCITGTEKTQNGIARTVYGDAKYQGKVSRALKAVEAWIVAGNVIPDLGGPKPKAYTIDPAKLGKGERRDKGRRLKESRPDD